MSYARLQWRNPQPDFRPFIRSYNYLTQRKNWYYAKSLNCSREGANLSNRSLWVDGISRCEGEARWGSCSAFQVARLSLLYRYDRIWQRLERRLVSGSSWILFQTRSSYARNGTPTAIAVMFDIRTASLQNNTHRHSNRQIGVLSLSCVSTNEAKFQSSDLKVQYCFTSPLSGDSLKRE